MRPHPSHRRRLGHLPSCCLLSNHHLNPSRLKLPELDVQCSMERHHPYRRSHHLRTQLDRSELHLYPSPSTMDPRAKIVHPRGDLLTMRDFSFRVSRIIQVRDVQRYRTDVNVDAQWMWCDSDLKSNMQQILKERKMMGNLWISNSWRRRGNSWSSCSPSPIVFPATVLRFNFNFNFSWHCQGNRGYRGYKQEDYLGQQQSTKRLW